MLYSFRVRLARLKRQTSDAMLRRARYPIIVLILLLAAVSYFAATRFVVHQRAVDRLIAGIPAGDKRLPPAATDVFVEIEGDVAYGARRGSPRSSLSAGASKRPSGKSSKRPSSSSLPSRS